MKVENIRKVGVIGAGTMGNGIAHVFAQFGYSVKLIDKSQEQLSKALETIKTNLQRQAKKGVISEGDIDLIFKE